MTEGIKLLLTRRWPSEVEQHLRGRYDVHVNADDTAMQPAELADAMRQFDAICPTVTDSIDAATLAVPDIRVRILANYGAGTDHIDLAAARHAGIAVTNTPDVLTDATAEIALLLMLMVSRRAGEGERELRAGRWTGWRPTHLVGTGLAGRQLGLVGFGRIGQATAWRARAALGVHIAYHSRHRAAPAVEAALEAQYVASLGELVERSDIISLHCPGGAATRHLIDAAMLARMRPGALLINTARGSLVDEAALGDALVAGRLGGAGLDVYEREPDVPRALLGLDSVVLLPHLGSATMQARVAMGMRAAANLDAFFDGIALPDHVG